MSAELNLGEYGVEMRFGVGEDVTGSTPALSFIKPDGTVIQKEVADGVSVGAVDYTNEDTLETFPAGYYVLYIVEQGLIDTEGRWQWRAEITETGPNALLKADYQSLTVKP